MEQKKRDSPVPKRCRVSYKGRGGIDDNNRLGLSTQKRVRMKGLHGNEVQVVPTVVPFPDSSIHSGEEQR